MSEILLEIKNVSAYYQAAGRIPPGKGRTIQALAGVSVCVAKGEALGIIGESGSGKTTLARVAAGLLTPSAGDVCYDGRKHEFRRCQSWVQMVFQDPYGSLNPSLDVEAAVGEGLLLLRKVSTAARKRKVAEALAMVGLPRNVLDRYPHQLSGGQQQRVALARALVTGPRLLVLDEPLAALDALSQARLLLLLAQLKARLNLSYLFVSHNLAAVRQLCDRVGVIHAGRLVECGSVLQVLTQPAHEYTARLLEAFLWPDPSPFRGRAGN
jgi:peptide/nickel transport system ATP-binding protein